MIVHAPHSDRAVQEYRFRSGAKSTYWLNELTKYVKAQGLWDSFRLYPFMNRTNAGTGATAYGLGGLTTNEMTLVNGPTWGSGGLAFASASSQYGTIPDFLGSETLTVFLRTTHISSPSSITTLASQWKTTGDERSWWIVQNGTATGDPVQVGRTSFGTTATQEFYSGDSTGVGSDKCHVAQWVDGGGRSYWVDKDLKSLTLATGSAQTFRYDSASAIHLNAIDTGSPAFIGDQTAHALAFLTGTVTDTQRETITDLINEL